MSNTEAGLLARIAELEKFVGDLAANGTRFDLNPTMNCVDVNTLYGGFAAYLRRMDAAMRERASEALVTSTTAQAKADNFALWTKVLSDYRPE